MIFNTAHNQETTRFTSRHVISGTVSRYNYVIVRNVIRAVGVTILFLSCICLIQNTLHFPACCGIIIVIVCEQVNIVSGDICGSNVVNHLLTVSGSCIMCFLSNTRCELYIRRIENIEIRVFVIRYIVTGKLTDMICKCITNSHSECHQILSTGQISCTFKSCDQFVRKILCINSISNHCTSTVGVKSVSHEISRTIFISEIFSHIIHENFCQRINIVLNIHFSIFTGHYSVFNG